MYLEKLELKHFRNYEDVNVAFSPQVNVLIGKTAQGKTNLLESIYVLAMARSHRKSIYLSKLHIYEPSTN